MKALTTTLLAALGVAGLDVAMAELKKTPPAKVDLTGLWKINEEQSDDPRRVVANKQQEANDGHVYGPSGGRRRGGVGVDVGVGTIVLDDGLGGILGGGAGGGGSSGGSGAGDRPEGDPEPSSMKMPLDSFLATREELDIKQQPDEVAINTVDETTSCKPAAPAKAPVPGGIMADQKCGWDRSAWVVELRIPGDELTRINRYELRKNGQQLLVKTQIKGGKTAMSGLEIERVYDRFMTSLSEK